MAYKTKSLYFSGQGAVKLCTYDPATGLPGPFYHVGDCASFNISTSVEEYSLKENVSGQRLKAVDIKHSPALDFTLGLRSLSKDNLRMALYAAAGAAAAKAITDRDLGDVVPGAFYQFGTPGSAITSVTAGAVAVDAAKYTVHADGTVEFTEALADVLVTGTQAAGDYLSIMAKTGVEVGILLDGINTLNSNKPLVAGIWRASLSPLEGLDFINETVEAGTLTLKGSALTPPAGVSVATDGPMAGYGFLTIAE